MPNVSWFAQQGGTSKIQCILPYDVEFCAANLFSCDANLEFDPNLKRLEFSKYFGNDELRSLHPNAIKASSNREMATIHFYLQFPFPISTPRVQFARVSTEYFADKQQYMMIFKSYQPDYAKFPLPSNIIEIQCLFFFLVTRMDNGKTLVQQIILHNIHGWATNATMAKMSMKGRGKAMQKQLIAFLKKRKDTQSKPYSCVCSKLLHKVLPTATTQM